jgi:signal peptide peptidase SppA
MTRANSMKAPLIHVASLIFNEPLAILPEKLEAILHAIGPRLDLDENALAELARIQPKAKAVTIQSGSSLTLGAYTGIVTTGGTLPPTPLVMQFEDDDDEGGNGKPYKLTPEGVAVIPVCGTLMKRNSWMSSLSGFSSYAGLAKAATQAQTDSLVKAILFDIDSPGGSTHGCFELSDLIYGMRGNKPVWGVANDLAASAAYALGSACDRLFLTRTAGVGSIGVFALHCDQSSADEQVGVKFTYIFAGAKKTDGNPHEPLSKSARADIQAEVDRENDIFIATVARNRGFAQATPKKIAATEAGVFFADNALPLLADEVGTFEDCLGALTQKVNGSMGKASGKVAISADSGNNAPDPHPTQNLPAGEPKEGDNAMAKLDAAAASAEELKRARQLVAAADAAAAAAIAAEKKEPDDEPDEDDEEEDDDEKRKDAKSQDEARDAKDAKKGRRAAREVVEIPLAANAAAVTISNLCMIAGAPELAADFITKGLNVDQVIQKLSARRSKASAEGGVNSYVAGDNPAGGAAARASVDAAIEQARVAAMNTSGPGTMKAKRTRALMELLQANPEIYSSYMEEKDRVASQIMFSGGGRALNDYVLGHQRRYMANLGLSTVIDAVPGHKQM